MEMPELETFSLVGGTALSLKLGHRISIDLDLFSNVKPDVDFLNKTLKDKFGSDFINENMNITFAIFCTIQNVKVDILHYPHLPIGDIQTINDIRIYGTKDIAAMKINAILGRGQKKDFFDLVELLKHYSLDEILDFHKQKYSSQQLLISIPNALTYFEDAEMSPDPISLNGQTWESVKKTLRQKVREFLK
jgi:hypothetical protein